MLPPLDSCRSNAAAGDFQAALRGCRELVDYWERTGAWTQQWTTLRNLADLLDRLDDHDAASLLRAAADEAPEAASLARADLQAATAGDADLDRPLVSSIRLDDPHA